ncbi:hypothetical protein B0H66DRAFT_93798 [Apodospora peruviana]|uniref:Spermatogenesis-associated protein 20-like TRX domain-containing protein n=1 Tax=Apodospora peruviana TaxID=516989 RepID=A0AAE0MGV8_9PEZI|nr:hypothetical protein B0H66DRAFT_93798 [Apodospora peruviana]
MMSAQLQEQQRQQAAAAQSPVPDHPPAGTTTSLQEQQTPELPKVQNRANESDSPYVRLHASTPVAWQLLDAATLARATAENKPIFMHIGFLADHHCRLTTQDSFSNPQVAAFLNDAFIPIIIDREERPDLDTIYQNYSEAVNATGGWPLNLFLTPDLYPIFGGTYWPGPGTEHSSLPLQPPGDGPSASATTGSGGKGTDGAEDAKAAAANDQGEEEEESCNDFLAISKRIWMFWQEQEERCRREAFEMLSKLLDFAQEGTFNASSVTNNNNISFGGAGAIPEDNKKPTETKQDDVVTEPADLDLDQLEEALDRITKMFDRVDYGFGTPKFPNPARLSFLLRLKQFPKEVTDVVGEQDTENAVDMALGTLRRIRDGGLRDHVGGSGGGGFMRFSVTSDWSMPHFEKMVGENALLLNVFLDAWLLLLETTKEENEFLDVVFELGDYLTSSLICQKEGGGFVTSEAADSYYRKGDKHMREGAYYLWTRREFDDVVGAGETFSAAGSDGQQYASLVAGAYWNVREDGNVPRDQDPFDEFINQNVLHVTKDVQELSRQFGIPAAEVRRIVTEAKGKLRAHREKERVRPIRDEKIVVSVNGMVISALSRAGAALKAVYGAKSEKYLVAARQAAGFVKERLWVEDAKGEKVLRRFWFEGRPSKTLGFADDYAFLVEGLLDLYEATLEKEWLVWAEELQHIQTRIFYDSPSYRATSSQLGGPPSPRQACTGGFYSTELETLSHTVLRLKSGMDKSQPSTNSVSATNLFRLGTLLDNKTYLSQAKETINAFEAEILQYPWLFVGLLSGVVTARLGVRAVRVAGEGDEKGRERYYITPRAEASALLLDGDRQASSSGEAKVEKQETIDEAAKDTSSFLPLVEDLKIEEDEKKPKGEEQAPTTPGEILPVV